MQIRLRIPSDFATKLTTLSPSLRGQAVAFALQSALAGVDLQTVLAAKDEMRRLGILLNQALRRSGGRTVDPQALAAAVRLIEGLTKRETVENPCVQS